MKRLLITLSAFLTLFLGGAALASAAGCTTAFQVASGGTGWCALQSTFIPFGNGTGPFSTSSTLFYTTPANRLSFTYGSSTAQSMAVLAVTGAGTSTKITNTIQAACFTTDGITCISSGGGSGTVTSITNGGGLDFSVSPITTSGTITAQIGTSSVPTLGQLPYWTGVGTPSTQGSVATTSLTASGVVSLSQPISVIGASASVLTVTGGTNGQALAWLNGAATWAATSSVAAGTNITISVAGSVTTVNALATTSMFMGTTGQNAYFNGTNSIIGTSSLFTTPTSHILIGTSTDIANINFLVGAGVPTSGVISEINGGGSGTGAGALLIFGQAATATNNVVTGGIGNPSTYFTTTFDSSLGILGTAALGFYSGTGGAGGNIPRMYVDSSGRIGIGTTSPFARLSIQANKNDTVTPTTLFAIGSSTQTATTTLLRVDNAGQVSNTPSTTGHLGLLAPDIYSTFTYATTTWTGTTTIPLGISTVGETWQSVQCFTSVGTLNVDFYHTSTHLALLNASTTVGTFTFTSNNTLTAGEKRFVDIGTPASSPAYISCTVDRTLTPQ